MRRWVWQGIVLVAVLVPFKTVTLESCRIKVIDLSSRPLSNATVGQYWRYYSLESADHQELKITDLEGVVMFPPRSFYSNLLSRALHMIGNLDTGIHSSWGPAISFVVDHSGYKTGTLSTVITGSKETFRALKRGDTAVIMLEPESNVESPVAKPGVSDEQT